MYTLRVEEKLFQPQVLYRHRILTLGGYSTNSVYVQIWFLAMAAAAFTSIAAGSRHNITIPFMIIFILVLLNWVARKAQRCFHNLKAL